MKKIVITTICSLVSIGLLAGAFSYTQADIRASSSLVVASSEDALIGLSISTFSITKIEIESQDDDSQNKPESSTNDQDEVSSSSNDPSLDALQQQTVTENDAKQPKEEEPQGDAIALSIASQREDAPGENDSQISHENEIVEQDQLPANQEEQLPNQSEAPPKVEQSSAQDEENLQEQQAPEHYGTQDGLQDEAQMQAEIKQKYIFSGRIYITNNLESEIEVVTFRACVNEMTIATENCISNQNIMSGATEAIPVEFSCDSARCVIQCLLVVRWPGGEASIKDEIPVSGDVTIEQITQPIEIIVQEESVSSDVPPTSVPLDPPASDDESSSAQTLPDSIQRPEGVLMGDPQSNLTSQNSDSDQVSTSIQDPEVSPQIDLQKEDFADNNVDTP